MLIPAPADKNGTTAYLSETNFRFTLASNSTKNFSLFNFGRPKKG